MNNLFRKPQRKTLNLDGKTPVIRCSICTGEQTAGVRDNTTGRFEEVMGIRNASDLVEFYRLCGTDQIERIY